MMEKLRVALIGASARSDYLYAPILAGLKDEVELVGLWNRSQESAKQLGEALAIPWYTDMDKLVRETGAQIGIVSVNYGANGVVGLMAVESGLHVLLETPIAHSLKEADAIIAAAEARNLKIEIAEQFHRRPQEQIKLKMIEAGVFGKIHSSFNDFAGHGYHGVSVMRSYLGFDAKPTQVVGVVQDYPLAESYSRIRKSINAREETQEHGIITFEGGQIGIFHWTNVGYDSQLRWWRSSRFLGEKGMGISVGVHIEVEEQLTVLTPDKVRPQFIAIERRVERVDGGALSAMIAHLPDTDEPIVWENPFAPKRQGFGPHWHDDEIGVAGCLMSLVNAVRNDTEPTYGPYQGRLDQEIILAIRQSSMAGGEPVKLPLDPETQTA